jgi:predicted nucleotidyltransferase
MEVTREIPTLDMLRSRRDELLRVASSRGTHSIRVFGSVARGEAHADSDIDLLVEMEPDRSVLDLSDLILDLEEALGRRVDVVEIRRPSPQGDVILAEAVAL